jgi:hypothetical protein
MTAISARKDRVWERQQDGEAIIRSLLARMVTSSARTQAFSAQLHGATAIRLRDIVDHLVLASRDDINQLEAAGWRQGEDGAWRNDEGMFPPVLMGTKEGLWIKVESIDDFAVANGQVTAIEGEPHAPLRRARVYDDKDATFGVIERNGFPGFEPVSSSKAELRQAQLCLQRFRARRREFDSVEKGLDYTDALVGSVVEAIGPHRACDLWLKAEREYWMRRCRAGAVQWERQRSAGVGWANVDHHTYDGSRRHFRRAISIFEKLGYELREMLYAGELAGWGSQVLEQPVIGSTIFADVDLSPEELTIDFAHEDLPDLTRHRRAGLLSALLGESILEAGINHIAGLYDQRAFRQQAQALNIATMAPFTEFEHLYQELTTGDWIAVDPTRVDALEREGHIGATEAESLRLNGSILSHLENIERNDAYKGFNREGIDAVLRKLDPRAHTQCPSDRP